MSGGFDLGESAEDADEDQEDEEPSAEQPATEQRETEATSQEDREEMDPREEPQFTSEDVRQFPTYLRNSVLEEFQQADTVEIQPFLADKGIKNVEKRELYDAVFRLATERPERVAELVIEGRNLNPDELDSP